MKGATLWLLKMKKLLQKRGATSPVLDGTGRPRLGTRLRGGRRRSRGGTSAGQEVTVLPEPRGGGRKSDRRRKGAEGFLGRALWGWRHGGLFVGPEEAGDFGAEEFDEGAGQHLLVFFRVLEVVLGVRQHVKESFDQLLVLWGSQAGAGVTILPCAPL